MALNIKNEKVHALAREAAARTGRSQTSVIEAALEAYLENLPGTAPSLDDRLAEVRRLVEEFNAPLTTEDRAALAADMADLYDEAGLYR